MQILFLLKDSGVERMTVFMEVIKELVERDIRIHIVVGNQSSDYPGESYYSEEPNIILDVLEENTLKNTSVSQLKQFIRKYKFVEKIIWTVVFFLSQWYFRIRNILNRKNKDFVFEEFLTPAMREYKLQKDYDYIWTTDEFGLLWADWINLNSEKEYKIIHHSYELYWEHYLSQRKKCWKYFKEYALFQRAKKVLEKVNLFIIQDEARWEIFCQCTGIDKERRKVLLPVSIKDYPMLSYKNICEKMSIVEGKKIIFYPTYIAPERGCVELVRMAQKLNDDYVTVLHGFVTAQGYVEEIKKNIMIPEKVIISNITVEYQELIDFHRNVWCVFLCYNERGNNNKYIVNSSNKLVMALQAGKPIITIGNKILAEFCSKYSCGIAIETWSEEDFFHAVSELGRRYEFYCKNARRCYEKKFNIKLFTNGLYKELINESQKGICHG